MKLCKSSWLFTALTILFFACGHSATAQDADQTTVSDTRCFIGSLSFSEGATARATETVMVCNADGGWDAYSGEASICFRDGKVFATGAVEGVPANAGMTIKCLPDGTWEERQTKELEAAP